MITIGIRVSPEKIIYSLVEEKQDSINIFLKDKLIIPLALDFPNKLNYVRKTFIEIINQYSIKKAGIRLTESNSRNISIERISIEAVIQELFSSCTIDQYFAGGIVTISSLLGLKNDGTLKKIIKGSDIPEKFKFLEGFNEKEKESTLAAFAALKLNN